MPVKKKPKKLSNDEIALTAIEFFRKKESIKALEAQCKKYRVPLESYVSSYGKELDNGSRLSVLPYLDVDVHLKHSLRVGKILLPEAIDLLREAGLDECIEEVPLIREDVIERLYDEGRISDDLLTKIYEEKSTYAFSVEIKDRFKDAPE